MLLTNITITMVKTLHSNRAQNYNLTFLIY